MNPSPKSIADRLADVRKDLLDLGLRNPLINYQLPRGKGLELAHLDARIAFRQLAIENRSFHFRSTDDSPAVFPLVRHGEDRPAQLEFGTWLLKEQLEKRLLSTFYAARTSIEEQGANTLFVAFGMLNWKEKDEKENHRAPLILVPVELVRTDARHRMTVKHNGEEMGANIALIEKLRLEFGLKLPVLPVEDDFEITEFFQEVRTAIQSQSDWVVDESAITLGFFSFAKFLMFRDLDPETWPDQKGLTDHPLLNSLLGDLGFASTPPKVAENANLDDALRGCEPPVVDNCDSSQMLALVEASTGRCLVIQGPPGTGKSQTIVNLIAVALHEGKKVLFVSEKMAALEVVKRRLDRLNLGAACLELHSNKTNKKVLIEELRRTVSMTRVGVRQASAELAMLGDQRDRLNAYCVAVNEPIGKTGETPRGVYAEILAAQARLDGTNAPPLRFADSPNWTAEDIGRKRALVRQLQQSVQQAGTPSLHPFHGSRKQSWLHTENEPLTRVLVEVSVRVDDLERACSRLSSLFFHSPPTLQEDVERLAVTARLALRAPDLREVDTSRKEWLDRSSEIEVVATEGDQLKKDRARFGDVLIPAAWVRDVARLRNDVAQLERKWWRFASIRWHRARREIDELCGATERKIRPADLVLLDGILAAQRASAEIAKHSTFMTQLLGHAWRGEETDFALLRSKAEWIREAQTVTGAGKAYPWLLTVAGKGRLPGLQDALTALEGAQSDLSRALVEWARLFEMDAEAVAQNKSGKRTLGELRSFYKNLADQIRSFPALAAYNRAAQDCANAELQPLVSATADWAKGGEALLPLFEKARLVPMLEGAFRERAALGGFNGVAHDAVVNEFRKLDEAQMRFQRSLVAARHCGSIPNQTATGQMGVLAKEFERKARFLPIRKLMERAGNAVQAIKPVFMMSPLSIANYLPAGAVAFDLAIFDEASQVRPADALGAIVRAKQVIVAGDSKQMPPTSFFDTLNTERSDDEEEDESPTDDIESVLGLFSSRGAAQRMLRWHYRSRHESLIAVSNRLFYDDGLVVFPSPDQERRELGLLFRHLPNSSYDRGGKRTNAMEARTVAAAVMDHAHKQATMPRDQWETLGVAAFSMAQMDAIQDEVEVLRKVQPELEEFFNYQTTEPFFVKNLENLQGDERDVIFISVGYGRTDSGYLSMGFGPLNRPGGERRLNVLISRARKRCVVFTNLTADDIDESKSAAAGVRALKVFLAYAQSGHLELSSTTGKGADSQFEEQVAAALCARGYEVESQVGCAGFFLDLAIRDPQKPGRYLLGIECDGAAYHSARSARDRDRLRQGVLEGLGWKIYRIWSTEWFQNPEAQMMKLVAAIEQLKLHTAPPVSAVNVPVEIPLKELDVPERQKPVPYQLAQIEIRLMEKELHEVPAEQLSEWLLKVVAVEGPIDCTEAARRVTAAAGVHRIGGRIQAAMDAALNFAESKSQLKRSGSFLWDIHMTEAVVRDRSSLPAAMRRLDLISPEEIGAAVLSVAEASFGIEMTEVAAETCKLLGFGRTSEDAREVIEREAHQLIGSGKLELRGTCLIRPQTL